MISVISLRTTIGTILFFVGMLLCMELGLRLGRREDRNQRSLSAA